MRRAAVAEVDLDRVRAPTRRSAHRDEVDREAPDHALARQPPADLARLAADARSRTPDPRAGGSRCRSGRAARRGSGRASRARRPCRSGSTRSCALGLQKSSPSIVSSTMPPARRGSRRTRRRRASGSSSAIARRRRLVVRARPSDESVAEAAHAVVDLDQDLPASGRCADLGDRAHDVVDRRDVLDPARVRHALLGEDPPPAALRPGPRELGARRRRPGDRARTASSTLGGRDANGMISERLGLRDDARRIRSSARGWSSSFAVNGRGRGSTTDTTASRSAHSSASSAGTSRSQ